MICMTMHTIMLILQWRNITGCILDRKGMCGIFQKKGKKKKKRGNIGRFGQKCTKFENILKKGKGLCAIIACNKLLQ